MALSPNHDRAECDRVPAALTTTRRVPWQPASMNPPDGSPRIATSACSHSGSSRSIRPRPFALDSISSQSYITSVMSCDGSATVAARCRKTASPDFMSDVPQPYSAPSTKRLGTLSAAGTVSMCPASITRDGLPRLVRASTASPLRITSKPGACSRRAASISSAMRCSWRDSLGMSTSAAVSAIGSARKSRPTTVHVSPVTFDDVTSASGVGVATIAADGTVLDTWFPEPELDTDGPSGTTRLSVAEVTEELGALAGRDDDRDVETVVVRTTIASLDDKPADAYDAYLRLHLLSHRLVSPHGANMDGIFGVLANVVWTNYGPCAVEGFELTRARLRRRGPVTVYGIDKFPRMVDYVVPTGVRIADAGRVRLGAHLASGTTVMHEGFVNYNAGTLGTSMVEGRISAGVVVDDGSDVGGGASIMGTLSGGGRVIISVGKRCLLGANSGLGISLGDDCVIEAGLYVTGGTKVTTSDGQTVKAKDLSGTNNLLFRRNSLSGAVEVVARDGRGITLNAALHAN